MPVVINDFEVVLDNGSKQGAAAPEVQQPPEKAPRGATPHEVETVLRREKERLARVQAH